ncbi:MAG: hypothetical protein JW730_04255 [Anaerolineales bacterium]|nr:hypothetical protein [Anaerolineales bacterium]
MKTNRWVASSQRLYCWLLQLYPQAYRAIYESEMLHLFSDQCQEAYKQRGRAGILSLWLRTLVDVGVTVIREHLSDPDARVGLLDAAPNKPLPWKGVLLVLIPGLIFFVSQIEQVTSNNDWFFLAFYRAGYFLILPVLLVWLVTRRFPVWGLIPLGLLYETLWNYSQRSNLGNLPFIGHWFDNDSVVLFGMRTSPYDLKNSLVVSLCAILLGILIWYSARQRQISRSAWKWLGVYGLMIALSIAGEFYRFASWWPLDETREYFLQIPVWDLYQTLPFLLLVFIGMFFARKHGGLTFLLLLGYLLPTVIFGRYGSWNEPISFYLVSLAVLMYRFVVALVAPVWLVRAASVPGRQRAAAIPVAIAIFCHVALNFIVSLAWAGEIGYPATVFELVFNSWGQLIVAAGLALAVTLYLPREKDQAVASPPALAAATE